MTALLIVDDNAAFAGTLLHFLGRVNGFTVAGLAASAEEALARLPQLAVDLALVDVSLPNINGIDLVAALRQDYPELRCIMLSGHHELSYVRQALAAGAQGYVLKEKPLDLIAAIHAVMAGEMFLSAELRP